MLAYDIDRDAVAPRGLEYAYDGIDRDLQDLVMFFVTSFAFDIKLMCWHIDPFFCWFWL